MRVIINIFIAALIILAVCVFEGRVQRAVDAVNESIQEVKNSIPEVELGILADLPQYQRDVQQCNALASKFVSDLRSVEGNTMINRANQQEIFNDVSMILAVLKERGWIK